MSKTTCPGCNTTMMAGRRYRLEPLAEFMGLTEGQTCRAFNLAGTTQKHARCHGITRRVAERIAGELREHPSAIWPELVAHDIEDESVPCAECGNPFIPIRKGHRYCTEVCGQRGRAETVRARRRARYAQDAEYREQRKRQSKEYYEEAAAASRRKDKLRRESRVAEDPDYYRKQYRRFRDTHLAYHHKRMQDPVYRERNRQRMAELRARRRSEAA